MRIPIITDLYERCHRYRQFRHILAMRCAINSCRTEYRDLCDIAKTHPSMEVRMVAAQQRDETRKHLILMLNDIVWMMGNYRLKYPKKQ